MSIAESHPRDIHASGWIADLLAHGVGHDGVDRVLKIVRKHMGMDVAFIAHFREKDRVFEHVDCEGGGPLQVGQSIPLEDGYCLKVVRGELPQFICDTSKVPAAMAIPDTLTIPIGAHMSVPIRLESGEIYGTLCCFSHAANYTLGKRDMQMMQAFGEVLATHIDARLVEQRAHDAKAAIVRGVLAQGAPRIVFQPIFNIADGRMVGAECLSRFDVIPTRPPNEWFDLAAEVDMGQELELLAIEKAVVSLDTIPAPFFLGINSSPELVISGRLSPVLESLDLERIVLEITEHAAVEDYERLHNALAPFRSKGLRLAIDDAGAGYSSMRHIVNLHSELIKLDMSLTRDIDHDPSRRALAKALIGFARDTGSAITAEGVENEFELRTLQRLGADKAQGYLLSKPLPLEKLQQMRETHRPFHASVFGHSRALQAAS